MDLEFFKQVAIEFHLESGVEYEKVVNMLLEWMPLRKLTNKEIAYILDISEHTVKSVCVRALLKIEEFLDES